jgi:hypothetical protein
MSDNEATILPFPIVQIPQDHTAALALCGNKDYCGPASL